MTIGEVIEMLKYFYNLIMEYIAPLFSKAEDAEDAEAEA